MANGAYFSDPARKCTTSHVGDSMVPLAWSGTSCACVDITEEKGRGGWGLLDCKPNAEQFCSFGCGSRVSRRARWRERSNSIGTCASTGRTPHPNWRYRSQWNTCDNMPQIWYTWTRQTKGKGKRCTSREYIVRYGPLVQPDRPPREMRIVMRDPTVEWDRVWINLHKT
jgi:hypothetical protein